MWPIEKIQLDPVQLDLSEAGRGLVDATKVTAEGVELFNAVELIEVDEATAQVIVCDHCGIPSCSGGGWVAFRRLGNQIALVPDWDQMAEGEFELMEYRPPAYMSKRGLPVLHSEDWERLRGYCQGLPSAADVPRLKCPELGLACQWSAPFHVLGRFPEVPHLSEQHVLAATEGDVSVQVAAINTYLEGLLGAEGAVEALASTASPIELWLDVPGSPGWRCFGRIEQHVCAILGNVAYGPSGCRTTRST